MYAETVGGEANLNGTDRMVLFCTGGDPRWASIRQILDRAKSETLSLWEDKRR
jgi:hypothetical protein